MLDFGMGSPAPAPAASPGGGGGGGFGGGIKKLLGYMFYGPQYGGMMDEKADSEMLREIYGQDMARNQALSSALMELAGTPDLDYAGLTQGVADRYMANPRPEVDPSAFKTAGALEKLMRSRGGDESKTMLSLLTRSAGSTENVTDREDRQAHSLLLNSRRGGDKFGSVIKTETFGDIPFNSEPDTGNPREVNDEKFNLGLITAIRTMGSPEDQTRWLNEDNTYTEEGKAYAQRARDLYKFKQVKEIRDAGIVASLEQGGGTEAKIADVSAEETAGEMSGETAADPAVKELRGKIEGIAANLLKNPDFDKSNPEHTKMVAENIAGKTGKDTAEILAMLMDFLFEGDE